jgi:hypothetical protein
MMRGAWIAIGLFAGASLARADETEVSFAYVPAPNAESVVIVQQLGKLSLHGWDKPEVRIVAHKHARDGAALDQLRVNVEMLDGHIRIRTGVRVGSSFRSLPASDGAGIDLEVDAPRRVSLQAATWAGDLEASGFRAGAQLSSRGGEVRASDIDGQVHTESLKGKQRLSAIRGDVEADGVTGDVELDSVDGKSLAAKVVEGQITARDVRSSLVQLFSSLGGIVWIGSIRPGARYEITAREGDVRLVLHRSPFTLHARGASGVESSFPLTHVVGSPTDLNGDFLGGGAQLELTAAHGKIELSPAP